VVLEAGGGAVSFGIETVPVALAGVEVFGRTGAETSLEDVVFAPGSLIK